MKTRILGKIFSAAIALIMAAQPALAAVPQRILYQGTLRQTGGLYTGDATFLFRITNSAGGAEYWNSGSTVVAVTAGLFRYPLGSDNPGTGPDESASFLTIDWSNISPYIEVTVNGNLLSPREEIQSVPYAIFNSAATDMVNPRVLRTGDTMSGQLTLYGSTLTVTGNAFSVGVSTLVVKDGNVGIGTTDPASPVTLYDPGRERKLDVISSVGLVPRLRSATESVWLTIDSAVNNYGLLAFLENNVRKWQVGRQPDNSFTFWSPLASDAMLLTQSGSVGIGVTSPASKLHVLDGDIRVSTSVGQPSKGVIFQDGTSQATAALGGNIWADRGSSNISNTNTGNVGVGITNPAYKLDVVGAVNVADPRGLYQSGARVFASSNTNVFAGELAGAAAQADAFDNVFVGSSAGDDNTSGDDNTFIGYSAGDGNTTGIRNTFIGSNAGASNISGARNVFLGYQAGFSETNSDKLYIDNSNTASPLLWGDFNTNVVNINGSLGVGLTNPGAKLEVVSPDPAGGVGGIRLLSGAAGSFTDLALGRAGTEATWGVAAGAGQYSDFSSAGDIVFRAATEDIIFSARNAAGAIRFGTGAADTEKMRIDNGGSVGIGTTAPEAALHVVGVSSVTTSITVAGVSYAFIPRGMVSSFNLASCPTGWSELVAARGRYVVGLPAAGTLAGTNGTALGDLEDRPVGQHNHGITDAGHAHGGSPSLASGAGGINSIFATGLARGANVVDGLTTGSAATGISVNNAGAAAGTNAPYIQLLVCQKD